MTTTSRTVLVVEHSAGVRRLLRTALEIEGASVVEAATLAEARPLARSVDVVVLDRELPDGDGLELTVELDQPDGEPPLVVLHTDDPDDEGRLHGDHASVRRGDVAGVLEQVVAGSALHQERPGDDDLPEVDDTVIDLVVDAWR